MSSIELASTQPQTQHCSDCAHSAGDERTAPAVKFDGVAAAMATPSESGDTAAVPSAVPEQEGASLPTGSPSASCPVRPVAWIVTPSQRVIGIDVELLDGSVVQMLPDTLNFPSIHESARTTMEQWLAWHGLVHSCAELRKNILKQLEGVNTIRVDDRLLMRDIDARESVMLSRIFRRAMGVAEPERKPRRKVRTAA